MKRITALLLVLLLLPVLSACKGGEKEPELAADEAAGIAVTVVQGRLDSLYRDQANEDYMAAMGLTEAECHEAFATNLDEQVGYFARYFEIDNLTDEVYASLAQLWTEVYAKADYSVGEATLLEDGKTYAVSVEIRPMDFIQLMEDGREEALAPFYAQYGNSDMESLSEEQYARADALWAQCILELAQEQLPNIGYREAESIAILATHNEDGSWTVADNDVYLADDLIVYFP